MNATLVHITTRPTQQKQVTNNISWPSGVSQNLGSISIFSEVTKKKNKPNLL